MADLGPLPSAAVDPALSFKSARSDDRSPKRNHLSLSWSPAAVISFQAFAKSITNNAL
jgi:hypothetical protein